MRQKGQPSRWYLGEEGDGKGQQFVTRGSQSPMIAMMAGHVAGQPLYTIEQFELIRRLRNSGITKEQVIQAFDALERMDRELGAMYAIPISIGGATFPVMAAIRQAVPASVMAQAANNQALMSACAAAAAATRAMTPQANFMTPNTPPVKQEPMPKRKRSIDATNGDTPTAMDLTNGNGNGNGNGNCESEEDVESTDEFKQFVNKGDVYCCEEIRNFVMQYNIKQQQVAVLSGISQSYVSRYLKGDFHDMSERSRRMIQKWYITFKNNPAAIGPAANAAMLTNSPVPVKKFISMDTGSSDFVNYPKRERFVFRPSHLEVLEKYFTEDSYPSQEKRDEISRTCNAAAEVPGRILGDRERVTSQIVANWFANKRKEVKKLAREEGIDMSATPLRGRGRPFKFISELTNMDLSVNTNGSAQVTPSHSPDEASALTALAQNALAQAQTQAQAQSQASNPAQIQNGQVVNSGSSTQQAGQGRSAEKVSQNGHSPGSQAASGQQSELSDPSSLISDVQDDQSLSLAVEMAAVNQAIIALSGQMPIAIKAEKPDVPPTSSTS